MRVLILTVLIAACINSTNIALCTPISGYAEKQGITIKPNRVVDSKNGMPISSAKINIPSKNYSTTTDENGSFQLQADINAPTIMSVEKDGYKPFSLTMDRLATAKPIVIGIEKSNPADVIIEQNLLHLGDDNFSDTSANATEFRSGSKGPSFTKKFKITPPKHNEDAYFIIGSVIGIDTKMAIDLGQSRVKTAYSSAPEVFFNNQKIAELKINGDHQEIKLPKQLIKPNQMNEITIKTGRNLFQTNYVDYDDIELMNLSVELH